MLLAHLDSFEDRILFAENTSRNCTLIDISVSSAQVELEASVENGQTSTFSIE